MVNQYFGLHCFQPSSNTARVTIITCISCFIVRSLYFAPYCLKALANQDEWVE